MALPLPTLAELEALAARHGTPFYLYDADLAKQRVAQLRAALGGAALGGAALGGAALGGTARLLYCVKANPAAALLEALRPAVDGLDVSSFGEVEIALRAGYAPAAMGFAGPGKTDAELEASVRTGVGLVSLESAWELERLARIARALGKRPAVLLRINPRSTAAAFAMKMGGGPSAFGIPEEDAPAVVARARELDAVELAGVHVYAGTQCLDAPALLAAAEDTLRVAGAMAELGVPLGTVNLGGGLGVPYFAGQTELDVTAYAAGLAAKLAAARTAPAFASTTFVLEVGRWIAAPAGIYVARVVDVKVSRGKSYVVLDGGMNHHFAATGSFGQVLKRNYPVAHASGAEGPLAPYDIAGPLCTPLDTLGRAVALPPTHPGDLLVFPLAGAYGLTASPLLFLGHRTPVELVRAGGSITVSRRSLAATELDVR